MRKPLYARVFLTSLAFLNAQARDGVYDVKAGGTGISYGLCWVNGNPFLPDWASFVGIGSGTGSGNPQPGYEAYHIFAADSKSTKGVIYFVVRSNKPWRLSFAVGNAKPGVDRDTKNSYGHYAVDDLTRDGTVAYLLTRD
jgi:hypothetical protein